MLVKPVFEKFKNINKNEVVKLLNDFIMPVKSLNTVQSNYLNTHYAYFYDNPEEFYVFAKEIIVNDKLEEFLKFKYLNIARETKLRILINTICVEILSLKPKSFDYSFYCAVNQIIDNRNIIGEFISILIGFGYKKITIDELSNQRIITLALEEMFFRDKKEFIIFVARTISTINLELSNTLKPVIINFLNKIAGNDIEFNNEIKKILECAESTTSQSSPKSSYTLKRKDEKAMFNSIPE